MASTSLHDNTMYYLNITQSTFINTKQTPSHVYFMIWLLIYMYILFCRNMMSHQIKVYSKWLYGNTNPGILVNSFYILYNSLSKISVVACVRCLYHHSVLTLSKSNLATDNAAFKRYRLASMMHIIYGSDWTLSMSLLTRPFDGIADRPLLLIFLTWYSELNHICPAFSYLL